MTELFPESDGKNQINIDVDFRNGGYEPTIEELEKETEYYLSLVGDSLEQK